MTSFEQLMVHSAILKRGVIHKTALFLRKDDNLSRNISWSLKLIASEEMQRDSTVVK